MKKIFPGILVLAILAFAGCEKQQESINLAERLNGQWEFIKATGGFTGSQVILPQAGSKTTLVFSDHHKYKRKVNGETVEQGDYELTEVNSIFTGEKDNAIKFTGSSQESARIISIRNDSLWLTDNHVEPYGYLYVRAK